MSPKLIFAASLMATFVAWYICSLIPGRTPRGILRAAFIALLCSPGVLIGHGFAVVPSLFARFETEVRYAFVAELPSTLLMIGYTMLGLWLLSTPSVG